MIAEVETKLANEIAEVRSRLAELERQIDQDNQRLRALQLRLSHLLTIQKCGS